MSQITRLFPPGLLLLTVKVWGYLSLSRSWGGVISYWHAPTQQRRVCGGAWLQHGSSRRQVPPQQTTAPHQQHHSSTTADTGGAAKQSPDRCKHWYWYPLRFKDSTIDPQKKCNSVVDCCCCRCFLRADSSEVSTHLPHCRSIYALLQTWSIYFRYICKHRYLPRLVFVRFIAQFTKVTIDNR